MLLQSCRQCWLCFQYQNNWQHFSSENTAHDQMTNVGFFWRDITTLKWKMSYFFSNRNIHIQHTHLVFWQLHLTCHPSSLSALIDQSNTWSQNSWRNTIKAGTKNKTSQRLTEWCLLCQTDSEMFTDKLRNEEFAVANVAALITCYFCSLSHRINRLLFSSSEPLSF